MVVIQRINMGVNWTILSEIDAETKEWLEESGENIPEAITRFPTGDEIIKVLESLDSFEYSVNSNGLGNLWQVTISDQKQEVWTMLCIPEFKGYEEENEFYFEKGHLDLILKVTKRLSQICGRFIVIPDTGEDPIIINEKKNM